jgi:hypothetical protein
MLSPNYKRQIIFCVDENFNLSLIRFKLPSTISIITLSLYLGWKSGSPDTILEGGHPRTIPPNLVAIDPVVSEEKIKMLNVDGRTTDEK